MPGLFSCFTCGSDAEHFELPRSELKKLYDKCIAVNKGKLIVRGIFARADTKNNNKRVYPKYILKREVAKFEQEHISRGTALGELDHPNYASRYFKCMNLPNISHQVLGVQWKGDQLWGTIEVLPTPSGLLLWELYAQGIKLGVSSRGWASLRTDARAKCVFVDDDFELITFDFVTEPSTKGAYLVPMSVPYKHTVPDQTKCVQTAFLGHGVVSMRNLPRLPSVYHLARRIKELQEEANDYHSLATGYQQPLDFSAPCPPGAPPSQPTASLAAARAGRGRSLDQLLLFCHYIVFPGAPYLDREEHARDFQAHVALFATRAHLADQEHFAHHRADFNAVILQEVVKQQTKRAAASALQDPVLKPQNSSAVAVAAGVPTPSLAAPPQAARYSSLEKRPQLPGQAAASAAAAAQAAASAVSAAAARQVEDPRLAGHASCKLVPISASSSSIGKQGDGMQSSQDYASLSDHPLGGRPSLTHAPEQQHPSATDPAPTPLAMHPATYTPRVSPPLSANKPPTHAPLGSPNTNALPSSNAKPLSPHRPTHHTKQLQRVGAQDPQQNSSSNSSDVGGIETASHGSGCRHGRECSQSLPPPHASSFPASLGLTLLQDSPSGRYRASGSSGTGKLPNSGSYLNRHLNERVYRHLSASTSLQRPPLLGSSTYEKRSACVGQAEAAEEGNRLSIMEQEDSDSQGVLPACSDLDSWMQHPSCTISTPAATTTAVLEGAPPGLVDDHTDAEGSVCVRSSRAAAAGSELQELQQVARKSYKGYKEKEEDVACKGAARECQGSVGVGIFGPEQDRGNPVEFALSWRGGKAGGPKQERGGAEPVQQAACCPQPRAAHRVLKSLEQQQQQQQQQQQPHGLIGADSRQQRQQQQHVRQGIQHTFQGSQKQQEQHLPEQQVFGRCGANGQQPPLRGAIHVTNAGDSFQAEHAKPVGSRARARGPREAHIGKPQAMAASQGFEQESTCSMLHAMQPATARTRRVDACHTAGLSPSSSCPYPNTPSGTHLHTQTHMHTHNPVRRKCSSRSASSSCNISPTSARRQCASGSVNGSSASCSCNSSAALPLLPSSSSPLLSSCSIDTAGSSTGGSYPRTKHRSVSRHSAEGHAQGTVQRDTLRAQCRGTRSGSPVQDGARCVGSHVRDSSKCSSTRQEHACVPSDEQQQQQQQHQRRQGRAWVPLHEQHRHHHHQQWQDHAWVLMDGHQQDKHQQQQQWQEHAWLLMDGRQQDKHQHQHQQQQQHPQHQQQLQQQPDQSLHQPHQRSQAGCSQQQQEQQQQEQQQQQQQQQHRARVKRSSKALSPQEFWSKNCGSNLGAEEAQQLYDELALIRRTMAAYAAKQQEVWDGLAASAQGFPAASVSSLAW